MPSSHTSRLELEFMPDSFHPNTRAAVRSVGSSDQGHICAAGSARSRGRGREGFPNCAPPSRLMRETLVTGIDLP